MLNGKKSKTEKKQHHHQILHIQYTIYIYIYSGPILHIQRSLSSKFQLQQLQKDASGQNRKNEHHY